METTLIQETILAPGTIVSFIEKESGEPILAKVLQIDRVYLEGGKIKLSLMAEYDDRWREKFPLDDNHIYLVWPDNCEVRFV